METDDLAKYLDTLDPWRVDAVLKNGTLETTQRVYFVGRDGTELGPFVRKRLSVEAGLGHAYEEVLAAQRRGVRFRHLPVIFDCSRSGDQLTVLMEYVRGETLGELVGRRSDAAGRLALAGRVFPQVCEAVAELSERFDPPIVHRDLKPSNVMVAGDDVILIDLGIARTYKEGAEQDTTRFGTRAYAPPEQFGFGQTSVASDVYALGMLLVFCLTGREPTTRERERGFEGLPEPLRAVAVRATRLDPAARFATPRELEDAAVAAFGARDAQKDVSPELAAKRDAPLAPAQDRPPVPATEAARPPASESAAEGSRPSAPATEPPTFDYPSHRGERVGALLARVPRWAGVAWDVIVMAFDVLFVIGCIGAAVSPVGEVALWPLWYRVLTYAIFGAMTLVGGYLVLDRRPLRRRIPALANLTVARETTAGLRVIGVLFAAWLLLFFLAQL